MTQATTDMEAPEHDWTRQKELITEMQTRVKSPPVRDSSSVIKTGIFELDTNVSNSTQCHELCEHCQEIDFDILLNVRPDATSGTWFSPIKLADLDHIQGKTYCPLCLFLLAMRQEHTRDAESGQEKKPYGNCPKLYHVPAEAVHGCDIRNADYTAMFGITWSEEEKPSKEWYEENASNCFISCKPSKTTAFGRTVCIKKLDYALIKDWLSYCLARHGDYTRDITDIPNVFFIDCESGQIIEKGLTTEGYLTLSYVWGNETWPTVMGDGKMPADIPLVVKDAMTVTQALGFRYLWIDRYCIPKDDETAEQVLINNMGLIYSQSTLTIIAAAGDNPRHGLPRVSSRFGAFRQKRFRSGTHTFVSLPPHIKDEIEKSAWNTRGWTYQEALLSSRRLVFTSTQVYFQCSSVGFCESIKISVGGSIFGRDSSADLSNLNYRRRYAEEPLHDIAHCIHEYMKRDLTHDSDALNAFRGILGRSSLENFFGLPLVNRSTRELTFALSWRIEKQEKRRDSWPSWSWLGWKGSGFSNRSNLWNTSRDVLANKGRFRGSIHWGQVVQPLIKVKVVFETDLLNWEEDSSSVLSRIEGGTHPHFLQLEAFALPITFTRNHQAEEWRPSSAFSSWLWRREREMAEHILSASAKSDLNLSFVAMILSWGNDQGEWMEYLVIRAKYGKDYFERLPGGHYCIESFSRDVSLDKVDDKLNTEDVTAHDIASIHSGNLFYDVKEDKLSLEGVELHRSIIKLG